MKHISAGGALFLNDMIYLVYKEDSQEWLLPKGHQNEGEDLRNTAMREVFEETGYTDFRIVADIPPIVTNYILPDGDEKEVTYYAMILGGSHRIKGTIWMEQEGLDGDWFGIGVAIACVAHEDIKNIISKFYEQVRTFTR